MAAFTRRGTGTVNGPTPFRPRPKPGRLDPERPRLRREARLVHESLDLAARPELHRVRVAQPLRLEAMRVRRRGEGVREGRVEDERAAGLQHARDLRDGAPYVALAHVQEHDARDDEVDGVVVD